MYNTLISAPWGNDEPIVGKPPEDKSSSESSDSHVTGNHITFYRSVSAGSIATVTSEVRKLSLKLRQDALEAETPLRPIHLHIHSYGGSVFAGLAMVDVLRKCHVPVYTHIEGGAASAATLFSVVGSHRTVGENSYILIHQLSTGFWGKFEELKDEVENASRLMETISRIYGQYTKVPKKTLKSLLKHDLWLPPKEALKLGLVDEIV